MAKKPVTERLKVLRERSGVTMAEVASTCGYKTASGYQRYEDPALFKAEFLPRRLVSGLIRALAGKGEPPISEDEIFHLAGMPNGGATQSVDLIGYVGAGNEAHYYGNGQGPLGEVERPAGASRHTVAVEVRGGSMSGVADDGSILYYDERRDPPDDSLIGLVCIVGLPDDRVLVKRLMPARSPGLYHLYSANAEPMLDQTVLWAAEVIWIRPPRRRARIAALAACTLFILTAGVSPSAKAGEPYYPTPSDVVAIQTAIRARMRDPESTRFGTMKAAIRGLDLDIVGVCGWFNSKNGFGGYNGNMPFYLHLYPADQSIQFQILAANSFGAHAAVESCQMDFGITNF